MIDNNKVLKSLLFSATIIALFFTSCAKEKEPTSREIQERILDAYIAEHYPNAEKLSSGLTIIELDKGTGELIKDDEGVYIHYDTYTFDGVCQSTTDSLLAKDLGTFSKSKYYGPTLFVVNENYSTKGMLELLKLVGKGGHVKAIIPPWLNVQTSSQNTVQESSSSIIYDVTIEDIVEDITQYQIDNIESYASRYFPPKIDSLSFGFYLKNFTHPNGIADKDTIKADTYVNIWYIGRLLDGYIFDTNIKDSAKKFGIYNSSNDYSPLYIKMLATAKNMNETQNSGEDGTSLILGFCMALKNMTIGDHATALFMSGLGYGSEGTLSGGVGVPWYSPLRFDIWLAEATDSSFPPANFDGE